MKVVGETLKRTVSNGKAGRYGGEEFMIVFETGDRNLVESTMNGIMEKFETSTGRVYSTWRGKSH